MCNNNDLFLESAGVSPLRTPIQLYFFTSFCLINLMCVCDLNMSLFVATQTVLNIRKLWKTSLLLLYFWVKLSGNKPSVHTQFEQRMWFVCVCVCVCVCVYPARGCSSPWCGSSASCWSFWSQGGCRPDAAACSADVPECTLVARWGNTLRGSAKTRHGGQSWSVTSESEAGQAGCSLFSFMLNSECSEFVPVQY